LGDRTRRELSHDGFELRFAVTVIGPATNNVTATLDVRGALEVGRADGHGNVWVNVEDQNEIVRIERIPGLASGVVGADMSPGVYVRGKA
jgi:hypothetical protein